MKQWRKLLQHWQGPMMRHALSLPFILGALRKPPGAAFQSEVEALEELKTLLQEISNHVEPGYFLIYRCPDLSKLVLRHVNGTSGDTPIPPGNGGHGILHAADGLPKDSVAPLDDLVSSVWLECKDALMSQGYSCRGGQFVTFNEYDLKAIRAALA